ncbi:unnamed protein product [Caenorhabditis auriculariae]|uniref:galactosylceramidase n=1 Tax=Caenorhabditis auriculariae TaxID=2777116 RepID=A0A8S1H1R5_9PELO|nr:unnamed protein product [Caenorhabditis auriculariae]
MRWFFLTGFVVFVCWRQYSNVTRIKENVYIIDSEAVGQFFDGYGAVSGGGATSKLMYTYLRSASERQRIMEILFNKEHGLQMLKVEMGGDDQSTEGTEASHWSERDEIPSARSYEFQLIREARLVNPDLPICVLPWSFPHWLGRTPYDNENLTALYVVEWLRIARFELNVEIYCVGGWNERNFSESYYRSLRETMDDNGFEKVKIVAGEGFQMNEQYDRLLDPKFINDYDIIGAHYPGGKIPGKVQKSGKTLWASEDFSTSNLENGHNCMARVMNWNYVHGNITGMLVWHLMSAFYRHLPWWRCGLSYLTSSEFRTEASFAALQYVTGNVKRGWKMLRHGGGSGKLEGGGTYVGYSDGKSLTVVFETMSYEKSLCEYSNPDPFIVSPSQIVRFKLQGMFSCLKHLHLSINYEPSKKIKVLDGIVEFELEKDSIGVLTSLPSYVPEEHVIKFENVPDHYYDDFEDYTKGEEPRYWIPQKGSWVVENGVAVQKVLKQPICWCLGEVESPFAVMEFKNARHSIKTKIGIPRGSTALRPFLGVRSDCGGCDFPRLNCSGIFAEIEFQKGRGHVFSHLVNRKPVGSFDLGFVPQPDTFYNFQLILKHRQVVVKFHKETFKFKLDTETLAKGPFLVIGSSEFGYSVWDDISVR